MTSKLKCPVCNVPLTACGDLLSCPNDHCAWVGNAELWQTLIQSLKDRKELAIKLAQTNQTLEQSEKCCSAWETQALDYKAETIALSGKLKIARKALEGIASGQIIEHSVFGHECDNKIAIARKALEQITHDSSEKANSQEHKEI